MGKCIICGCETKDFRCCVRIDENGNEHDDYQCEKCTIEKVKKQKNKYEYEFNKIALPYLLENNFKVVVKSSLDDSDEIITEEFPIKDSNVMYCVDIIRERMTKKGYYENWIDVHWEKYKDIEFEVVDYLSFALPYKADEFGVSYTLEIIGDNELSLLKIY